MKSQASVEFMILVGMLVIIFLVMTSSNISLQQGMINIKSDTEARKLSDKIAFEVNTAAKSGDGYKRKFLIEESFAGISDFTIEVGDYQVRIVWSDRQVSSEIVTRNITGVVNKGQNLIENRNGVIYVS